MRPPSLPAFAGELRRDPSSDHALSGKGRARGRDKAPVIALVERGGDVRFRMMARVTAAGLADALTEHVSRSSCLITDESPAYKGVGKLFAGGHHTVAHGKKEYVRVGTDVHSNTVEGVFSLLQARRDGDVPQCQQEAPAELPERV